jgi:hypothetical protein
VIVIKDELVGLIHALNQYRGGKGHDRQVLLSLWSGFDVVVDRKSGAGPVHLRHPFVAIVVGIQPSALAALQPRRGGVELEDGLLDRFLFAWPEPPPFTGETWRELSADSGEWWDVLVKRLLKLGGEGQDLRARELALTETGRRAWQDFTLVHANESNQPDILGGPLLGAWSKLRVYAARLALILQALRWASGETGDDKGVDGVSVRAAVTLVDYFKRHVRKVHGALHSDPVQLGAESVVEWLAARPAVTQFTRGELYQHVRRRFQRPTELDEPLALLADLRYLTRLPGATTRWQVNPLWQR